MEIIILSILAIAEAGIIAFQSYSMRKLSEDCMDKLLQKSQGIYYPKGESTRKEIKEVDDEKLLAIEDISDEDFLKAVRKGAEDAR